MISILELFRTGYFGSVTVGISWGEVLDKLGEPDWFQTQSTRQGTWQEPVHVCTDSDWWQYSGIQLYFDYPRGVLSQISFKPGYFHNEHQHKTRVDSWIFKDGHQPNKQELIVALRKENIEVKDTGILLLARSRKTGKLEYFSSRDDLQSDDELDEEDAGFLVMRSGVEVCYAGNAVLSKVSDYDGTNKVVYVGKSLHGIPTFENTVLKQLRVSW